MSVPQKHHYLPAFYIDRWAFEGTVCAFRRPRGAGYELKVKTKPATAIGYQRNLYAYPNVVDPTARQAIEMRFLQRIDDRAAAVFAKVDSRTEFTIADSVALTQFLLSLLHRSPSRLDWLRRALQEEYEDEGAPDENVDEVVHRSALDMLVEFISSREMVGRVSAMAVYCIPVWSSRFDLMTSDRPTIMSNGLSGPGFLMIPADPRHLLVVTSEEAVVDNFQSQAPRALVKAINDAVVTQARHFVVATAPRRAFVDKRFLKRIGEKAPELNPTDGMVRWQVP